MYWCTQNCISTLAEPEILPRIPGDSSRYRRSIVPAASNRPCALLRTGMGNRHKKGIALRAVRAQTVATLKAPAQRVLIYRLGSLGDTLIALPALHLVARAFP